MNKKLSYVIHSRFISIPADFIGNMYFLFIFVSFSSEEQLAKDFMTKKKAKPVCCFDSIHSVGRN